MVITLLGTGTSSGVPLIGCGCEVCRSLDFRDNRLRVSVHISVDGQSFVIDTGPDFRQQMLRHKVKRIDAVLLTHAHKDHIAGMDDVRAYNFLQKASMPIYGNRATLDQVRSEFYYVFEAHKYPGIPQLELYEIDDAPFVIEATGVGNARPTVITPIPVMHAQMPVLGFRINAFAYVTDVNYMSENAYAKLKDLDVLILDALQPEHHPSHFTLDEAIEAAQRINAKTTYFTHMSHRMGLHASVEKNLPPNIKLGYDGLVIRG